MSVQFQRFVSADRRRQTSSWNHADHHHHLISKSVRSKVRTQPLLLVGGVCSVGVFHEPPADCTQTSLAAQHDSPVYDMRRGVQRTP